MKAELKKILVFIMIMSGLMLFGCSSDSDNETKIKKDNLPDYFGPELYNAAYALYEKDGSEITQYINVMSRIEIPEALVVGIESTGGEFDFSITTAKGDYKIDDYTLYEIKIELKNIKFTDEVISINEISIYDESAKDKIISIKPQKCEFTYTEGNFDNDDLIFTGTPLSLPKDMNYLTYEIDADERLTINEIKLSNDDFIITNRDDCKNIEIKKNQNTESVKMIFKIRETELSKYTQYITSAVFYYTEKDVEYISMTPVNQIIYNHTLEYDDNLAEYYNEVILKSN